jgi:hypothetical protein
LKKEAKTFSTLASALNRRYTFVGKVSWCFFSKKDPLPCYAASPASPDFLMTRRTPAQALMLTVLALRFAPQATAAPPGATPTYAMRRAARVLISIWQPQSGVPRTLWLGQNGKLTPLLRDNSYKGRAALSPLGDKIAFLGDVSHDIADGEIDVIDLQGHSLSKTLLDTNNASPQLRKWYPEPDPKLQSVPINWESLAWVGNRDDTVAVSGSYN